MHTVSKALLDFYEYNPSRWTKKFMARDKLGFPAGAESEDACQWCLLGAVKKLRHDDIITYSELDEWILRFAENHGNVSVNNDNAKSFDEIVEILERT